MRRTFREEKAPARLTPIPQGASESVAGQLPEQEATQKSATSAPVHREKGTSARGKFLKAGIITFASLGIVAALVPLLTGASVGETAQFLNLQRAYSPENLTYLRGTAALKLGQYDAAIGAFKALPRYGSERNEFKAPLFTQLLEAQEYGRAVQVLDYLKQKPYEHGNPFGQRADPSIEQQMQTYERVGAHMGATLGLEKAMAKLAQEPALAADRPLLVRALFFATAPKEMAALQKLAPTLPVPEQTAATEAILVAYKKQGDWNSAWQWTLNLPTELRHTSQDFVLNEVAQADPKLVLERLTSLRGTPDYLRGFQSVLRAFATYHPREALPLLEKLETPQLLDRGIGILLTSPKGSPEELTLKEVSALLARQVDPVIKARTLLQVYLGAQQMRESGGKDFINTQILPQLTALAQQNPAVVPLHDAYWLNVILNISSSPGGSKASIERYLPRILDPGLRASVKKDLAAGLHRQKYETFLKILRKSHTDGFPLTNPTNTTK